MKKQGMSKYDKTPAESKWPKIKRNASSVGAWCYLCKSEHRFAGSHLEKSA